ncbi:hypothetical protein OG21DRAFT_1524842 [Imleria badia]|nr:hypothetical protein OG21DRAFT_1524842 [Imleria badia]
MMDLNIRHLPALSSSGPGSGSESVWESGTYSGKSLLRPGGQFRRSSSIDTAAHQRHRHSLAQSKLPHIARWRLGGGERRAEGRGGQVEVVNAVSPVDIESMMAGEVETSKPRASIGVGESAGNFSDENIARPDTTNHPTNANTGLGRTYLNHPARLGGPRCPLRLALSISWYVLHANICILVMDNTSPTPPTRPHISNAFPTSPTPIMRPQHLNVSSNASSTPPSHPPHLECLLRASNASNAYPPPTCPLHLKRLPYAPIHPPR